MLYRIPPKVLAEQILIHTVFNDFRYILNVFALSVGRKHLTESRSAVLISCGEIAYAKLSFFINLLLEKLYFYFILLNKTTSIENMHQTYLTLLHNFFIQYR